MQRMGLTKPKMYNYDKKNQPSINENTSTKFTPKNWISIEVKEQIKNLQYEYWLNIFYILAYLNYICLYDWSNIIATFYTASQPNKIDYGFFANFPSLPLKAAVDLQDFRKWWSKIGSQCDKSEVESTKQPPHTREVSAVN